MTALIHPAHLDTNWPYPKECWVPNPFHCPDCGNQLECEDDYASGSNHYWGLLCRQHGRFTASTYSHNDYPGMTPKRWEREGVTGWEVNGLKPWTP